MKQKNEPSIQIHGHRGCRGLFPENSMVAFEKAIDLGVDAIEIDVIVSADGHLVISHEPWAHYLHVLDPNGNKISRSDARKHNFYTKKYPEIEQYTFGTLPHSQFPNQQKVSCTKPLLDQLVDLLDAKGWPCKLNIEVKSYKAWYGKIQPLPYAFAQRIHSYIMSRKIQTEVMVQCFDPTFINALHLLNPTYPVGYLIENTLSVSENLSKLDRQPSFYNPHFSLVNEGLMRYLRDREIGIFVWTVNSATIAQELIALGVNGLITDYPDKINKKFFE